MEPHYSTVFSNQQGIAARVCPRGLVALSIGHTSLTLQKVDFLRLAQVIRNAESRVRGAQDMRLDERRH
jgi:hypothetical protein